MVGACSSATYEVAREFEVEGLVVRDRGWWTLTTDGVKAGPKEMQKYRDSMRARGKEVESLQSRVLFTTGMLRDEGYEIPPGLGPGTFDVASPRFWLPDRRKLEAVAAHCGTWRGLAGMPFALSQYRENLGR